MKKLRDKIVSFIAVLAVLALSSCGSVQTAQVTSGEPVSTTSAAVTEVSETETSEAEPAVITESSGETEETDGITETAAETQASEAEESEAPETTAAAETSESAETTTLAEPETEESVTEAPKTEPTPAATSAPEETVITTTTSEPKNAAKPSPSQVKEVSSPGKAVFGPDNAKFDYSNCSKGYVSVNYTGSTKLKMLLKKDGGQYDYDIPAGGGIQYFTLSMGSGKYIVEIYEMVSGGKYVKLFSDTFTAKIADTTEMYLYRNQYINFNAASKCVAKASEVCAGCTTNLEKITAVFKYVTDTVTYDKALAASVTSGYIPDPDSVLAKKKGICFDYASLTAAMLRSQGVPTRLVIGYASPNIYHAWNEVYTKETGWITAEIKLDSTGFNRIDATFYASASNKKNFADYIAKSGNYSDVYIY
uniref:Transglutaminase-like domain-containing protein n=1 Tax=uncultured bacterium Ad_136_J17_contig2 TaxID=1489302 RepID=A0A0B4N0E3_9BACT|nr:putative uncharacterized protein [uncultured bacterium Ad_136_J17_contig2]